MTGTIAKQLGPGNCLIVSDSDGRSNYFTASDCKNTYSALFTKGKDILNRFSFLSLKFEFNGMIESLFSVYAYFLGYFILYVKLF